MAYIIGESFEDKFIKTEVHFDDSREALDNFFKTTKAFPGTSRNASWKTGSSAFKDAVEEIEPGRHQFFPITVVEKAGIARPESYFIFTVVGRIDSIIEEKSNLKPLGRGQIDAWTYERETGPWRCALDAAIIGERACWIEHRYGARWFVSDRLVVVLQQRQLCGFNLDDYCEEISR